MANKGGAKLVERKQKAQEVGFFFRRSIFKEVSIDRRWSKPQRIGEVSTREISQNFASIDHLRHVEGGADADIWLKIGYLFF